MTANFSRIEREKLSPSQLIEIISARPKYFFGAFKSAAAEIIKHHPAKVRQEICYAMAVSSFTLKEDATCFALANTVLGKYNELAGSLALKQIKQSTFFDIQKRATKTLVTLDENKNEFVDGKWVRHLGLNFGGIASLLPSVFNKATHHAVNFFNRFPKSHGFSFQKRREAREIKGWGEYALSENWSSKDKYISKDINNYKDEISPMGFTINWHVANFGKDAQRVAELHDKATSAYSYADDQKTQAMSGVEARELISLYVTHEVHMKPKFRKFLLFIHKQDAQSRKSYLSAIRDKLHEWAVIVINIAAQTTNDMSYCLQEMKGYLYQGMQNAGLYWQDLGKSDAELEDVISRTYTWMIQEGHLTRR